MERQNKTNKKYFVVVSIAYFFFLCPWGHLHHLLYTLKHQVHGHGHGRELG